MILFYAPDIRQQAKLPEQESQHCVCVLRRQVGDKIDITDGKGFFYKARITEANPKQCRVQLLTTVEIDSEQSFRLEIAIAPVKNIDRIEWFAEKATEIGIDTITFLRTSHSERKELKLERIRKILITAMKQSGKAILPKLQDMISFEQYVRLPFNGQKFISHCRPGEKPLLSQICRTGEDIRILIGPEGDFSAEEIIIALANGYRSVSLGKSRLRTETAALTVCQTIHVLNQLIQK